LDDPWLKAVKVVDVMEWPEAIQKKSAVKSAAGPDLT